MLKSRRNVFPQVLKYNKRHIKKSQRLYITEVEGYRKRRGPGHLN